MANHATSTGKIRPAITSTVHLADGTTQTVTWIRRDSLVRRLRRHLAKKNHRLLISAECSPTRDEFGEFAVLDTDGHPLQVHADLDKLARFLNVLADDEVIEPPAERGWRYHIARKHSEISEGQARVWLERVSRDFRSERAARMALEAIENRTGLVIIGDAAQEDSTEAMAAQWEREQQARQADAIAEVHAAIEANPTLRYLRSEAGSQADWDRAVGIDLELQRDTAWARRPVAERFDEVVNRLAVLGLAAVESGVSTHD